MSSWVEKYRPKSLDGIIGQENTINILEGFLEQEKEGVHELPHFLFSGPTGVGKTATAMAFANELGVKVVDYNASNDRGIDTVRDDIKRVAKQQSMSGVRIVFLDEIDSMTEQAQRALRRTMEDYSDKTKFILSCNHPAKLLDAIRGRCVERRFPPVEIDKLVSHLKKICDEEGINYEEKALQMMAEDSRGLVRNAIQQLQALSSNRDLTKKWVSTQTTSVTSKEIRTIFSMVKESVGKDIRKKKIDEEIVKLYQSGTPPREILISFYEYILEKHPEMVATLAKIGDIDANISQGADPLLQLRCFMFWLIGKVKE